EFRALAGLYHPNLVRMHELFSFEDEWFFTMDLIEGGHFRAYVRGGDHDPQTVDTVVVARRSVDLAHGAAPIPEAVVERARNPLGLSVPRLRHALGQLA